MSIKNYKAVVFDMDGVIFDSERAILSCWEELAEKQGISHIREAMYECLGVNEEKTRTLMLQRYGENFPYETFRREASVMFHERYDNGRLPMKKGVRELLSFLKAEKKKIALASSTKRESVLRELEEAGVLSYFDAVICGDMVERSKPAPDIYCKACEALGIRPEEAYAVEDSYNGVRSAHSAGLHTIMVPDLAGPTEEMEELTEIILPDLTAIVIFLTNTRCKR